MPNPSDGRSGASRQDARGRWVAEHRYNEHYLVQHIREGS